MFVIYYTTTNFCGNLTEVISRTRNRIATVNFAKYLLNFCYFHNLVHKFLVKVFVAVYNCFRGMFVNIASVPAR